MNDKIQYWCHRLLWFHLFRIHFVCCMNEMRDDLLTFFIWMQKWGLFIFELIAWQKFASIMINTFFLSSLVPVLSVFPVFLCCMNRIILNDYESFFFSRVPYFWFSIRFLLLLWLLMLLNLVFSSLFLIGLMAQFALLPFKTQKYAWNIRVRLKCIYESVCLSQQKYYFIGYSLCVTQHPAFVHFCLNVPNMNESNSNSNSDRTFRVPLTMWFMNVRVLVAFYFDDIHNLQSNAKIKEKYILLRAIFLSIRFIFIICIVCNNMFLFSILSLNGVFWRHPFGFPFSIKTNNLRLILFTLHLSLIAELI